MRDAIRSVQNRQIVGGRVVDEAPVFGAHEYVTRYVEIGAAAVNERSTRLGIDSLEVLRIEYQGPGACRYERCESLQGHPKHVRRGRFVRVVLHPKSAARRNE